MVPFLLLNIVISAVSVLVVWNWLERNRTAAVPTTVAAVATVAGDAAPDGAFGEPADVGAAVVPPADPNAAAPVATAAPPSDAPVIHTVTQGETLGAISVEYDVSVADIVQANNLASADSIFVGQRLTIPVGGIAAPTAEAVAAETTPTPVPTVPFAVGESTLEISAVEGVGDVQQERVIITNVGANAVALNGWTVSDDLGNVYTFGDINLFGGGASITLHSRVGSNTGIDFFWNAPAAVWSGGETAVLRDAAGNIQAQRSVP